MSRERLMKTLAGHHEGDLRAQLLITCRNDRGIGIDQPSMEQLVLALQYSRRLRQFAPLARKAILRRDIQTLNLYTQLIQRCEARFALGYDPTVLRSYRYYLLIAGGFFIALRRFDLFSETFKKFIFPDQSLKAYKASLLKEIPRNNIPFIQGHSTGGIP